MSKWSEYLSYGWRLVELRPGTKMPRDKGWQEEGARFNDSSLGAGLVHQWSKTCALDVDDYDKGKAWFAQHDIDLDALFAADDSVQILSGRSNHGKLLYALPEALKSKKVIEAKKNIIDFRCIGNQDVLPPSIHPDTGKPYRWVGDPMLGLPQLPAALEALWRSLLTPVAEIPADGPTQAGEPELAELLASRDPDCDYLEWLKVGMAVHAATNGQGFYIWDNWAKRGDKYNVPADGSGLVGVAHLMSKWQSFRADGGVGVGSLRAEKVAAPEDFPTEQPVEDEYTGRQYDDPGSKVHSLLQPRLVFLTSMDRFYFLPGTPPIKHLDEHANCGLRRESLNDMFLRFMPDVPTQRGFSKLKPLDSWRELPDPQIVDNIGFHPGEPRLYTDVDGMRYLNRFVPQIVEPLTPKIHELEAWDFLISRIKDPHYRRWLMQFYGFVLRNPGVKITQAPLLFSEIPGTGKSTLMSTIPSLLFGWKYVNQVTNDMLNKSFNATMADSWFIVLDELKTNGGRQDRAQLANKMKPWITDAQISIERKGLDVYQVPNRLQITATSNYDDAVQIDDDDRRWAVSEMGGKAMTAPEIADLYDGFLNTPRAAGVLKHIFSEVSLVGFSPTGKAPRTAGRTRVVATSLGVWETKLIDAALSGVPPFDHDLVKLEDVRALLMGVNAPQTLKLASLLRRPPFNCEQLRLDIGRLYAWRNASQWRAQSAGVIKHHMSTGERPAGIWSDEIPIAIRRMAGDDSDPNDVTDLLGGD